jgi:glycosyltransferase involved in cell wall biosynthesis
MLGKKTVVKVTGSGATGNMAMLQTWRWLGGWVRALIARADCLISLTDEITSELLENGMDPDKIVRIPNGVDVDAFRLATPKPGVASERTVLGVGRLTREKGFDVLVEAWSGVAREIDDAHLIILGDGLERGALTTAARKAGVAERITFVGDSAEVPSYLATSKVFVLPSRHEGMANALLEAMAAGRACLASDIRANAAVIQSGVNGLLFKSEDPADLTVQLVRLLQDDAYRTRLGAAAQQTIIRQYSIDAVARRYLRLYSALMENRPLQAALSDGEVAG